MKPVFIFQHDDSNGPGAFGRFLDARGIPSRVIRLDHGEEVPGGVEDASGLCFLGGVMSANDPLPHIAPELELIRAARARGMPVIGHCLGGQLMAKALGGVVAPSPVREIGWHRLQAIPGAAASAWIGELSTPLIAMQWHADAFTLPPGADPLLTGEHWPNQAFVIDHMLAMQCHVEVTADIVRSWVALYADEIGTPTPSVQAPERILEGVERHLPASLALAEQLYERWATPLRA